MWAVPLGAGRGREVVDAVLAPRGLWDVSTVLGEGLGLPRVGGAQGGAGQQSLPPQASPCGEPGGHQTPRGRVMGAPTGPTAAPPFLRRGPLTPQPGQGLGVRDSWCGCRGWSVSAGRGWGRAAESGERLGALCLHSQPSNAEDGCSPGPAPSRVPREKAAVETDKHVDLSEAWPSLCCGDSELDVARRGPHSRSHISADKQHAGRAAGSPLCPWGPPAQKDQRGLGPRKEEGTARRTRTTRRRRRGGHPCPGPGRLGTWPARCQGARGPGAPG